MTPPARHRSSPMKPKPISTSAGPLHILGRHEAYVALSAMINDACAEGPAAIALSGGSTPLDYYRWAVQNHALHARTRENAHWHVSDERCVPLESEDSNFGNAARALLDPLGILPSKRHPWPAHADPEVAVATYMAPLQSRPRDIIYNLCLLGLGDDAHTASLWPGCPLIGAGDARPFAATEWPGRGRRLTITEAGLARCDKIVVLAFGEKKADALKSVLEGGSNAKKYPAQVLRQLQNKTVWIVDEAAAARLSPP